MKYDVTIKNYVKKDMFALAYQSSPVGEGGSRSETDEAPNKILFFASAKIFQNLANQIFHYEFRLHKVQRTFAKYD